MEHGVSRISECNEVSALQRLETTAHTHTLIFVLTSMTVAGDGRGTGTEVCPFRQKFANLAYLSILHSVSHQ